jgi:ABC-type sugar transport system permease subunit
MSVSTSARVAEEPPAPAEEPEKRGRLTRGEGVKGWLFVGPTLLALAIVIGYPVVRAVVMSLQEDKGLSDEGIFVEGGFAGLSNYTDWILQRCGDVSCPTGNIGSLFWDAVFNTFFLTVVTVTIEVLLGLWFATIMHRNFKGRGLLRASVLIPWAIPTAVTAQLWYFIFSVDGIFNKILGTQILWTDDKWAVRFGVVIADVWKTTPFMALLILAGLQIISDEVYEAAQVDGASAWQRFIHITLPLVKPALLVAILFRTLDVLRIFDLPYILTNGGGGEGNAVTTLSMLVVRQIGEGVNGAAALSTITFVIIFAVAFVFVKFLGAHVLATQEEQRKGAK